jgi:hypothetical protein
MTKRDPRDALLVPPGRGLFLFPSILETSGLNFFGYFNSKQTTLLFKPILGVPIWRNRGASDWLNFSWTM